MEALRIAAVFEDSARTLLVVESVVSRHRITNGSCRAYASVRPRAIVICDPAGTYALDMEARPISLDRLRREVPDLDARIARSMR
jgi:hypothetical protein